MLTALDQIANQNHLLLIKAAIPYIAPGSQKIFSILIKMVELQNVLKFYNQNNLSVQVCHTEQGSPDVLDILTDLRNYCEDDEAEMIDQCIQMFSAMELYSIFSQPSDNEDTK